MEISFFARYFIVVASAVPTEIRDLGTRRANRPCRISVCPFTIRRFSIRRAKCSPAIREFHSVSFQSDNGLVTVQFRELDFRECHVVRAGAALSRFQRETFRSAHTTRAIDTSGARHTIHTRTHVRSSRPPPSSCVTRAFTRVGSWTVAEIVSTGKIVVWTCAVTAIARARVRSFPVTARNFRLGANLRRDTLRSLQLRRRPRHVALEAQRLVCVCVYVCTWCVAA